MTTTTKPNYVLANGATIIEVAPVVRGGYVVLARWGDSYVSWAAQKLDHDRETNTVTLDCYWGNYHNGILEAATVYVNRINQNGGRR